MGKRKSATKCASTGYIGAALVMSSAAVSVTANAADAVKLAPSGPWSVDFADDSCKARRTFENGERTAVLEFESLGPGPAMDVRIASDSLTFRPGRPSTQFVPGTTNPKTHDFFQTLNADGWRGVALRDAPARASEKTTTAYLVKDVFRDDLDLETGPLDGIMSIMRKCEDDLFATLGLDAEAHRALTRSLEITGKEEWLKVTAPMQRDFRAKKGSTSQQVRLLVDAQGKVTACRVLGWPEDEAIAKDMCDALFSRARFAPALDAQSHPIKSFYILALSAVVRTG